MRFKGLISFNEICFSCLTKYLTLNIGYRTETTGSERASGGICINNQEIKTAETLTLLGKVDFRLIFSEHVNSACKMASQRIAVLMRLRSLIPIKANSNYATCTRQPCYVSLHIATYCGTCVELVIRASLNGYKRETRG